MHWIDWSIVAALMALLVAVLVICQRHVRSTADFLVANRCAGRYLLTITTSISGLGAISVVALFEQYYESGFAPVWWNFLSSPIWIILAIAGWVYYRFRETRCMTMAQFFEVRYSKRFRIFSGIVGWFSGVLNYGIFPAVSVKFFIFFCRIPEHFTIPGIPINFSTYACLLFLCIGMGVAFAIAGGQIAIMITDFIQGMFCNLAFLLLMAYLLFQFEWGDIFDTLQELSAGGGHSLFNPLDTQKVGDFNLWFFIMGIIMGLLTSGTWQGGSGYSACAKSPHEMKMSRFLGTWRSLIQLVLLLFIPICAMVFFHHAKYAEEAVEVNQFLSNLSGSNLTQARVPAFLAHILPVGLMGLFAAVMFAAMLSTDDTYIHSWGSIFIQDVVLPFRKKPFNEKQHIWLLRGSIVFVGIFAFTFSMIFKQTEYIFLFFQITGAIFTGGAGAVLIGGLYSRVGSTLGAWIAMILGSVLSLSSIAVQQLWTRGLAQYLADHTDWAWVTNNMERFPLNGQVLAFSVTLIGFSSYFIFSWLERTLKGGTRFDLKRMLHRDGNDIGGDHADGGWNPGRIFRALGLTPEFTLGDRILFFVTLGWSLVWFVVFFVSLLGGSAEMLASRWPAFSWLSAIAWEPMTWLRMWQFYIILIFVIGGCVTIWLVIGGLFDTRALFKALRTRKINLADDGRVIDGKNSGE